LLDQSVADVGTTIWDAEVILAHYIDTSLCSDFLADRNSPVKIRALELGAGTALSGHRICDRKVTDFAINSSI
jgi:hypothetical protein